MRLINADALIEKCGDWYVEEGPEIGFIGTLKDLIDQQPTIQSDAPRVMTLDEIKDGESYWFSAGKEFVTRPVICVHREDDARKPYITFAWQFGTFSWEIEDYGKTWCCWTSRPTEEQRKAARWE